MLLHKSTWQPTLSLIVRYLIKAKQHQLRTPFRISTVLAQARTGLISAAARRGRGQDPEVIPYRLLSAAGETESLPERRPSFRLAKKTWWREMSGIVCYQGSFFRVNH